MISALLLAAQATLPAAQADSVPPAQVAAVAADSVPRISLEEAIRRSARLDPDYVQALGDIGDPLR